MAAVAMIPDEIKDEQEADMQVSLDDFDMEWAELQAFWQEIKDVPEATFVTVETTDQRMKVVKEGNYIRILAEVTSEHGTIGNVEFPLSVIDAMLSSTDGTLNYEAALEALILAPGFIVSMSEGSSTVSVWIDDQSEVQ